MHEYFFGKPITPLSPKRITLLLSKYRLLQAGVQLSEGMRIIGDSSSQSNPTQLERVKDVQQINKSILAILHPPAEDDEAAFAAEQRGEVPQSLIHSNVAGFVYVLDVSIEQDTMDVLSPCPGALPSIYLLLGSIKFQDI